MSKMISRTAVVQVVTSVAASRRQVDSRIGVFSLCAFAQAKCTFHSWLIAGREKMFQADIAEQRFAR